MMENMRGVAVGCAVLFLCLACEPLKIGPFACQDDGDCGADFVCMPSQENPSVNTCQSTSTGGEDTRVVGADTLPTPDTISAECTTTCLFLNGTADCVGGVCQELECEEPFEDCNGDVSDGCEASLNLDANCGGCGNVCGAGEICQSQSCVETPCVPPNADCESPGVCNVNIDTSNDHCGGCGQACPTHPPGGTATCIDRSCRVTSCTPGAQDCNGLGEDGCETAASDPQHCGECGKTCLGGVLNGEDKCIDESAGGVFDCVLECDPGFSDCDPAVVGCETHTDVDRNRCGSCSMACGAGQDCEGGQCVTASDKRVFVSSFRTQGDFGSVSFADSKCDELARGAGLGGGPWLAWLGAPGQNAAARFRGSNGKYVRTDNAVVVANSFAEFASSNHAELINHTETANLVFNDTCVWTAAAPDGAFVSPDCSAWQTTMPAFTRGRIGSSERKNIGWTDFGDADCDSMCRFYCIED